jgi:hypothetical protein
MTLPAELFAEAISLKQVVFACMTVGFLVVAIPMAIRFSWMDKVCIAGIMFMAINPVDVTFFSYTFYRGDIRGLEFGITDWLTITMIAAMLWAPRWRKRRLYVHHPNQVWMTLYLALCAFSVISALVPQFAFFGVTKLLRAYATFWIAFNFIRSENDLRFIIWCVLGLTFYSFFQVLMDKYVRGVYPPRGSFPHQNGLATFQNIMNFIIFALLMQDSARLFDKRTLVYWAAFGAGVLTTLATLSRGGIVTMIIGCAMIVMLTFLLRQDSSKIRKKLGAIGIMILLSIPALFIVLPKVIERFQNAPVESGESRNVANLASERMGDDYFLGVGLNNYSFAINYMPYGKDLAELDRGIAHHIFWLHYAELGILGVILYVLLTGTFIWISLRFILKRRDSKERVFAVGIFTAFVINWLIGTLEWNFRIIQITLAYFMLAGFVTSLDRVEQQRIRKSKTSRFHLARRRQPRARAATLRRGNPQRRTVHLRGQPGR